ncbi:hypothetical protein AC1031_015293 [Aphanomyces cochlioides]|nr:hypothetical protein AC1031_015293 [Aphanomyces cochlioides]
MPSGDVRYQGMLWLACSFLVILFLDSIQEVTLLQKIVLVVWCFLGKVYLHDLHAVAVTPAKSPYPLHSPRRRANTQRPTVQTKPTVNTNTQSGAPNLPTMNKSQSLGNLLQPVSTPTLKRSQTTTTLLVGSVNPQEPSPLHAEPASPRTDSEEDDLSPTSGGFSITEDDNTRLENFKRMVNLSELDGLTYTDDYLLSVLNVPGRAVQYAADKLNRIIQWRKEYNASSLCVEEVGSQFKTCSMYWYGYDNFNRPILWLRPKKKDWAHMNNDLEVRANVFILELAINNFMPPGISCFTLVLDCKDVGYRETDISLTKNLCQVTTGNYPDRIGCVAIGPLTMLVKALTRILSPLLPPRLREKARFMDNPFESLAGVMPVDLIPTYMGGTNPHYLNPDQEEGRFEFEYMCAEMRRRMTELPTLST